MERQRFDDITRALAAASSRRRALKALGGALVGALLAPGGRGPSPARAQGGGGNRACAERCKQLFPPGKERGRCISQGARGLGPCAQPICVPFFQPCPPGCVGGEGGVPCPACCADEAGTEAGGKCFANDPMCPGFDCC
jgi:hypothetical protein